MQPVQRHICAACKNVAVSLRAPVLTKSAEMSHFAVLIQLQLQHCKKRQHGKPVCMLPVLLTKDRVMAGIHPHRCFMQAMIQTMRNDVLIGT